MAWGYLRAQREAVLWKVEGLPERDQRMPLTPSGTNLLGVVKHLAGVEAEYFGMCLGEPWPEPMAFWADDAEPNADMWATEDESPEVDPRALPSGHRLGRRADRAAPG